MIKDSGTILLTEQDLEVYRTGALSQRIKELWPDLTFEELRQVIQNNNYKVIQNDGSETGRTEDTSGEVTEGSSNQCSSTSDEDGTED